MKPKLLLWIVPALSIAGCTIYFLLNKKKEITEAERYVDKYIQYSGGIEAFNLIENCYMESVTIFDDKTYGGKYWYVDKKFRMCVHNENDTVTMQLSDTKKTYQLLPIFGMDGISKIDDKCQDLFVRELDIERNNPLIRLGRYRQNNAKIFMDHGFGPDGTVLIRLLEDSLSQYFNIDTATGKPVSTAILSLEGESNKGIYAETYFDSFKKTKDGYFYPSIWTTYCQEMINDHTPGRSGKIINSVGYNIEMEKELFEFPKVNEQTLPIITGHPL